ncbi:hypothetical protein ABGB12_12395 [Actinocorallia sp. B10E7]|uniref:hypothetical protein n=1 Tax=Actinocorallia sp. B10E7 TaxID=3153558 RepID=UPI00325CCA02
MDPRGTAPLTSQKISVVVMRLAVLVGFPAWGRLTARPRTLPPALRVVADEQLG